MNKDAAGATSLPRDDMTMIVPLKRIDRHIGVPSMFYDFLKIVTSEIGMVLNNIKKENVLSRCEWGHDDYSLQVENLPKAPLDESSHRPKPGQFDLELK